MRSTVNGRNIILKNDTTNTGGTVLTASSFAKQTQSVACVGDSVYCPLCKKIGTTVEGDSLMKFNGIPVALEWHKVACGCSGRCVLLQSGKLKARSIKCPKPVL